MDRITSTDKFKELKKNFRVLNENTEVAKKCTLRQSPRIQREPKKFDINSLRCSFRDRNKCLASTSDSIKLTNVNNSNTNSRDRNSFKASTSENINLTNANFRNSSNGSRRTMSYVTSNTTNAKKKIIAARDDSGFLRPLCPPPLPPVLPPPPPKKDLVKEELTRFIELFQILTDNCLFSEVEIDYHLEKISNRNMRKIMKTYINKSSSNTYLPEIRFENIQPSLLQSYLNTPINRSEPRQSVYLLRDWTVIKGSSEVELFLSGTLVHMQNKEILEQNHRSSNIIQKIKDNIVKTICCTYHLDGNIIGNDIPPKFKKYFGNGYFPDDWKYIAAKWHAFNRTLDIKNLRTVPPNTSVKRTLQDPSIREGYEINRVKKIKTTSYISSNVNCLESRTSSTSEQKTVGKFGRNLDRSVLNTSVRTRSIARKDRLPMLEPLS